MARPVQNDSSPDNLQQSVFDVYISFSFSFFLFLFSSLLCYYFSFIYLLFFFFNLKQSCLPGSSEHSECSVMEDFLSKHFLQQVWPSDSAWIKTGKEGKKKDSSISATR